MADGWFDDWVYQIVLEKKDAPNELVEVLNQKPRILPAWDPMDNPVIEEDNPVIEEDSNHHPDDHLDDYESC
ncbi:7132_t:CDS:2 [Racocetra fulgida]|uniref:7132_t:CDS:1 n=1 Tax=Racocetra fulgida TaxID=60492 RepID=A0A9N9C5R5_9GLOM|nr:7132_t:CDS:2 [Racocetra fulgida]